MRTIKGVISGKKKKMGEKQSHTTKSGLVKIDFSTRNTEGRIGGNTKRTC